MKKKCYPATRAQDHDGLDEPQAGAVGPRPKKGGASGSVPWDVWKRRYWGPQIDRKPRGSRVCPMHSPGMCIAEGGGDRWCQDTPWDVMSNTRRTGTYRLLDQKSSLARASWYHYDPPWVR